MRRNFSLVFGPLACISALLLTACNHEQPATTTDKAETPTAPADPNADFVTWTQDGQVYKATDVSAFRYQTLPVISINGGIVAEGQGLSERTLTLSIPTTFAKPGTYPLPQSGNSFSVVSGQLVLPPAEASTPRSYSTEFGPAAANGSLTLTECNPQAQRFAGTFEFTAKSMSTASPATQTVTAGSFRLTKLQVAPNGI
ncbi:DUF6252 family protein [Hymenobacter negativus]|uniref:Lipoprotein n=1 Tax=Hymenobacter negativus TaxID=2795026 RepID=A0ABS3QJC7_9BACT|nr:DUF6252 family protein [Hymenobacter negativus]MBO2010810.1 hypothetical protein [Hymenobacter negativus]